MELNNFVELLQSVNAKGYLVGGAVRDSLMWIEPKDRDYCVTGVTQEQFMSLFPSASLVGASFPVFLMDINGQMCEVALARTERKVGKGHTGFEIDASPSVMIEEDLARRDLTINSMAIDLSTDELIDPWNGELDLRERLIRATSTAFAEDPLRVYRAARFAAQFGFDIEYGTLRMMKSLKGELSSLSIERVRAEMEQAFMKGIYPSMFFRALKEAELLDVHFPEIDCLSEYDQNPEYHPEGDVFQHTMQVLDAARFLANTLPVDSEMIVMYSALLHDVGKALTRGTHPTKGTPTYHAHEAAGVKIADAFLDRFKLRSAKKSILFNVENHMIMHDAFTAMRPEKAVDFMEGKFVYDGEKYIRKTGLLSCLHIQDYIVLCIADVIGRLKDVHKIPGVVHVMEKLVHTFNIRSEFKFYEVYLDLKAVLSDSTEADRLALDLITSAKHKTIMEDYYHQTRNVECSIDINDLKKTYSGEDLGYVIHNNKRVQKKAFMRTVRSDMKSFLEPITRD